MFDVHVYAHVIIARETTWQLIKRDHAHIRKVAIVARLYMYMPLRCKVVYLVFIFGPLCLTLSAGVYMDTRFTPEAIARDLDDDSDFNFDTKEQNSTTVHETNFNQEPLYNFPQPVTGNCSTPISSYSGTVPVGEGRELLTLMKEAPSGQQQLSLQVTELQECIATVECCLDDIRDSSSNKDDSTTSRRVEPQLTVGKHQFFNAAT